MTIYRGTEFQLATQLGMIDDVGAVGLQHVLNNADGLGIVVLRDGLCCQLLIATESWRKCFGMLAGYMVEIVGLHVTRGHCQTIVNRTEGILVACHVCLVEGALDF